MKANLPKKASFKRNVLTLMTGTSVAQAVPIAISPILTRLYSPEEFGLFALYMSLLSVLAVIVTGRYELAILLPKRNDYAFQVAILAAIITICNSAIVLMVVLFFNQEITVLLGNDAISPWLYLLPLSILLSGLYQTVNYWHNRNRRYPLIATNRVVQSASTGGGQLGFGLLHFPLGLIVGAFFGQLISFFYLTRCFIKLDIKKYKFSLTKTFALSRCYSSFPKLDVPAALSNVIASQAPNILLATLFSSGAAGFYYLTQRVLQAPITLISGSILDVFKERASSDYKKNGECKYIFKRTLISLFFISVPASIFLFFCIEDLFVFVFGDSWRDAGVFAKLLIPALSLRFIANPLSFMFYICEKQLWNLLGTLTLVAAILASLFISNSAEEAVFFISVSYTIIYALYIFLSSKLAKLI
jgi:O-antigen/teichoic acid export membrane protein